MHSSEIGTVVNTKLALSLEVLKTFSNVVACSFDNFAMCMKSYVVCKIMLNSQYLINHRSLAFTYSAKKKKKKKKKAKKTTCLIKVFFNKVEIGT